MALDVEDGNGNGTGQLMSLGVQLMEAVVGHLRAREDVAPAPDPDAAALRRVTRLNRELAAALGACHCWGRRPGCRICGGLGRPGFFEIDRGAFAALVAPALAAQPHVLERRAGKVTSQQPTPQDGE